jgi:hypothetical protein
MAKIFRFAGVGIAAAYLIWVAASRFLANRAADARGRAPATPASAPVEQTPASGVRILHFYASTGIVARGDHAIVCYGVENARAVRIAPPVEDLSPSLNRCFSVAPSQTTTYSLHASGPDGSSASESFTVKVVPAAPRILFVQLSEEEVSRGQPITLCYGVANAASARLEPVGMVLRPTDKVCFRMLPIRTTEYTLVASAADGRTDREKFTIRVR